MSQDSGQDWIKQYMKESFAEQKRSRRWGVVFKLLTFTYLFVGLYLFIDLSTFKGDKSASETHTALVQVHGVIAADQDANANAIVTGLRLAFENEMSKAVILHINSPGGSPVQAGYVYDEIKRLRNIYPNKLVYAVISELGASGGYYIAAAADEIYADKASLVGSIGVTASSFGFTQTMEKLGVERRHFTAGEHKAFLDPFSPLKQEEKAFWQQVLDKTHQQFIDVVKQGRGERLVSGADDKIFSGLIWNGEQALELGLVDGLASPGRVARDIIRAEDIVNYTVQPSPLDAFTKKLGLALGQGVSQHLVQGSFSMQ